jgi:long-chain acyl-CoA synthetase
MTTPREMLLRDFGTLSELVRAHARARPRHPTLVLEDAVLDAATLDARVDRVAAALQRDGVRPGDAVALCAENSIEWIAVFLGALRAGAVVAPLSPAVTGETLAKMIDDAEARVLFVDASARALLVPHRARFDARWVTLDGASEGEPLATWQAPPGVTPQPVALAPGDPCNLIYTSGTTGTPKGIVQPCSMRWAHVTRGPLLDYGPDAVTVVALPLSSNTALVSLLPALGLGGTVVLMRRFDAAGFLALAPRHGVTHAMLVPVLFQRLLAHEDFDRTDLSSFQQKTCTSAPFLPALKAEVLRRWPGPLTEFYGMSEGGASCMLPVHLHPDKLHTVGRPQPGHELRLIDDSGREVPIGEVGEVVGRSPMMMTGYHRLPEQTRAVEWFDGSGRRFIRTGDIGRLDHDGFLELLDRKKDVIVSGGANVYPSDLEEVLGAHPAVAELAVVGVPSSRWGETPVAFVVLARGPGATATELLSWANDRLGRMQRLAAVELVDTLPRSAMGKVLKRDLRDAYLSLSIAPVPAAIRRGSWP